MSVLSIFSNLIALGRSTKPPRSVQQNVANFYRKPGNLTVDDVFAQVAKRSNARLQALTMARKYGLRREDLSVPNWRAALLAENCDTCEFGGICFLDRSGNFLNRSGINDNLCPNVGNFKSIAKAKKGKLNQ